MGRGALLGSKCMEIKASYVQARRFIDFHTLILNSYIEVKERTGYYELYNMCNDRGGSFVFCGAKHAICKLL